MPNIEFLLNLFDQFPRIRSTFKGLIAIIFLVNSLFISLFSVAYFVLKGVKLIETPDSFKKFIFLVMALWGICNLIMILFWLYWRSIPQIPESKVGILFAPHSDPECKDLIYKLYDQFKLDIKRRRLLERITHKFLPENQIVMDHLDAHNILNRSGARLIIYGYIKKGNIRDEMVEGFRTISFSIGHRPLSDAEKEPFLRDLVGAMAFRMFISSERNSFIEKDIVIENIGEVACFFNAVGLALEERTEDSKPILEHLRMIVRDKMRIDPKESRLQPFYNSIVSYLTFCYYRDFSNIYNKHLVDNITQRSHDNYAEECSTILDKIAQLKRKTDTYFQALAIIYFHFDRINAAIDSINKAKTLNPQNCVSHISSAFLSLWQDKYKSALKDYVRAEKCTNYDVEAIVGVISFLQGTAKNHPGKVQIKFGLAFVNDRFYDSSQAIKDYKSFLAESGDDPKFYVLRDYALKRIRFLEGT